MYQISFCKATFANTEYFQKKIWLSKSDGKYTFMLKIYLYLLKNTDAILSIHFLTQGCILSSLEKAILLISFWSKNKSRVMVLQMTHWGYAVVLQYTCCKHHHRWLVSTFTYAAQGSTPPAVSSPQTPPHDSSKLSAFPLGNRNTGCSRACPCHPPSPLTHPITFNHRLGFATWGVVIWGLGQLARGAPYAGDSRTQLWLP